METRVTTDAVIIDSGRILLVKRKNEPFKGMWALPGGFLEFNERTEDCAIREAKEETGLDVEIEKLIGVYSAPNRDPRGHTVTVAYLCRLKTEDPKPSAGDDAAKAWWFPLDDLPEVGFDHAKIIEGAKKKLT